MFIEFGEPESVLNGSITDYLETSLIDGYYEPPISYEGLAKSFRANSMHSSAIFAKKNIVSASVDLHESLTRENFERLLLDFLIFGVGYLPAVKNRLGDIVKFQHVPALYMRRREKVNCYSYVTDYYDQALDYKEGSVWQTMEYDPAQEIYGIPQYFAALSSIWLNEDATLFRRKYYKNGAHSGFLLYMNNPNLTKEQEDDIKAKLNSAKGLGNFKNMFVNGKGKDGEKPELIPVGQINAKDEFSSMKNVTTGDILSSHRIPIELMSVMREGFTTSSDLNKVDRIFYKNEVRPIVQKFMAINDFAGFDVIKLKDYESLEPEK